MPRPISAPSRTSSGGRSSNNARVASLGRRLILRDVRPYLGPGPRGDTEFVISGSPAEATAVVPPAWYRDPTGEAAQRYWDGASWTAWVADGPESVRLSPQSVAPGSGPPMRPALPGWFPDPGGEGIARYWDGSAWTTWLCDTSGDTRSSTSAADPDWAPPPAILTYTHRAHKARNLASISMAISLGTLVFFIDLFAIFTAPFSIGLAIWAVCASKAGSRDRKFATWALWLAIATLALWPLLIPLYNGMNEGL